MTQETKPDPGQHYRGAEIFGIPVDTYRILEAFPNINREGARHIVKKILRMGRKGNDERALIAELRCCVDRWEQMLNEEESHAEMLIVADSTEARYKAQPDSPTGVAAPPELRRFAFPFRAAMEVTVSDQKKTAKKTATYVECGSQIDW